VTGEDGVPSVLLRSLRRTVGFGLWLVAGLLVVYIGSGIYTIEPSEVGVVLRFGRVIEPAVAPGIHYAMPSPIDQVFRVPVRQMMRLSVDDLYEHSDFAVRFRSMTGLSSCLITGDNNIVTVKCVLQYSVQDPVDYLFSLTASESVLRSLACNTLIPTLAALSIDDILTTGKAGIQLRVKQELQRRLDELHCGLALSFVELQDVRPPETVQQYFNDVINARIDKDKLINNAKSYRNERIPRSKAAATRLTREAEAYRQRVIARAEGDTQRFLTHLVEYRRAPIVTRQRLHHELLQEVLPRVEQKTVVDREGGRPLVRLVHR